MVNAANFSMKNNAELSHSFDQEETRRGNVKTTTSAVVRLLREELDR